jgi:hypothetical protein
MNFSRSWLLAAVLFAGCAHNSLSSGELDSVQRPAFIARTLANAGPKGRVFDSDGAYKTKLNGMNPSEADRRLVKKLARGMNRWEVSERLRASTAALLPKDAPWNNAVDPADVARVLQSLLVEEEGAGSPDYQLLKGVDADSVIEIVIEDYGLRSSSGKAGPFVRGYGRMFKLRSGQEMWHRSFEVDQVSDGEANLDPFRVAKTPELFRTEMASLIDAVAEQFAKDLTPQGRSRGGGEPGTKESLPSPGDTKPPEGQDEELPLPDPS